MTIFDLALGIAALIAVVFVFRARAQRERRDPLPQGSPLEWKDLLDDRLPILAQLSPEQRQQYHWAVAQFCTRKRFVGCAGLEVTEEMMTLVGGMACLMILRPGAQVFPDLKKVLLYPGPFLVHTQEPDELGLVSDEPEERIGESWQRDQVILSWQDVEAALEGDEVNVVVHEFAHQLDDESTVGEGAPVLADYTRWSEVMRAEFERLRRHRRPRVLDPYGGESPAEFFGVVSEAFFQRGPDLAQHHPRLYELLRDFYGFETRDLYYGTPD